MTTTKNDKNWRVLLQLFIFSREACVSKSGVRWFQELLKSIDSSKTDDIYIYIEDGGKTIVSGLSVLLAGGRSAGVPQHY